MSLPTNNLDLIFTASIHSEAQPGAWSTIIMPDSSALLGTRKPVKVGGDIDGKSFRATLLPVGDGRHMLPIKASLRFALGKGDGDQVTVHLTERYS